MADNSLQGRVAIVTGGGWNVGRGVAVGLATAGARVVVASRNAERLADTVRHIESAGGEAFARPTDVTDLAQVEGLVADTIAHWGTVDVLAAMAGGGCVEQSIETIDPATWSRIFDVNVTATFFCVRAVLPIMRNKNAGTILTCSGGGSYYPALGSNITAYASAKAAICRMTDQLTAEYWETDLRIHCLDPGLVWDPPTRERVAAEERESGRPHPERPLVRAPADVAELAVWLASDASRPLRGRCVSVYDRWWRDPAQARAVHATVNRYRLRRDDL